MQFPQSSMTTWPLSLMVGSVAAEKGRAEKINYVSSDGGAMLEYLEGKVLPGIAAVQS